MKYCIYLFFAVLSFQVMAQPFQSFTKQNAGADAQYDFINQKTSALDYRLITIHVDSTNGTDYFPLEEVSYNYSNDRGGNYLQNLIPFASGSIDFDTSVIQTYTGTIYIPINRIVRIYNADNTVSEEYTDLYNLTDYDPYQLETFEYGPVDLDTKIKLEWNGSSYDSTFRNSYTYDGDLLIEKYVERYYLGDWGNRDLYLYNYNADNLPDTILIQKWVSGDWNDREQYIYTYNADGFIENLLYRQSLGSGLEDNVQVLYTFNTDSQLVSQEQQLFTGTDWNNLLRYDYTYDSDGNLIYFDQFAWSDTAYIVKYRYTFTYETYGEVVAIETPAQTEITIFPNPAHDAFTISLPANLQCERLQLFSASGEIVAEISSAQLAGNTVSLKDNFKLDAGVYLLACYLNNGERIFQKLIIQ